MNAPPKRLHIAWVILISIAAVGMLAGIFIPAIAGQAPDTNQIFPTIFWGAIVGWAIARFRTGKAWKGLLPGAALGFACLFVAAAISGAARGYQNRATVNELLVAAERFDPKAAEKLRTLISGSAPYQTELAGLLSRAMAAASDAAIIDFDRARMVTINTPSGRNLPRCVAAARGSGDTGDFTATEVAALSDAMEGLLIAAAQESSAPLDVDRAETLLLSVYDEVDPSALLDDPSTLSDEALCDMYLELMGTIHRLPPADAALTLRYMATSATQ